MGSNFRICWTEIAQMIDGPSFHVQEEVGCINMMEEGTASSNLHPSASHYNCTNLRSLHTIKRLAYKKLPSSPLPSSSSSMPQSGRTVPRMAPTTPKYTSTSSTGCPSSSPPSACSSSTPSRRPVCPLIPSRIRAREWLGRQEWFFSLGLRVSLGEWRAE